jgi:hypothetical protein
MSTSKGKGIKKRARRKRKREMAEFVILNPLYTGDPLIFFLLKRANAHFILTRSFKYEALDMNCNCSQETGETGTVTLTSYCQGSQGPCRLLFAHWKGSGHVLHCEK